ncbi:MAG: phosphoglycerate kinase [Bacilli bacterium]
MKTILDLNLKNKTVILRCDLNVSIKDGKIIDDTKIKSSLKTINYILEKGGKVVILSHLGKIKTEEDKKKNDMKIVYRRLNELIPNKIEFINETSGKTLKKAVKKLDYGKGILIQNTRYEDLNKNKESSCDKRLSKYWAKLGDIYINDAFGTIHRAHASNYGISNYLESAIGFLVMHELENLNRLDNPKRPFVVIMGGSKISDKIGVISSLIKQADYILVGGAMAFTFLEAKGYKVGDSLFEEKYIDYCKYLLKHYGDRIILPTDLYGTYNLNEKPDVILQDVDMIPNNFIGLDIGDETIKLFKSILKNTKTVFWNGPLGAYEYEKFRYGTNEILKYLKNNTETVILGGGDIVGCSNLLGYTKDITFASTGGGATLKYLENHNQPGLRNMN